MNTLNSLSKNSGAKHAMDPPIGAIVVARRSWREIFLWETPTHEKLTKSREHLSQSR
jgi:hypothetical protein